MAGTIRTNYEGETILDGQHGKKCPDRNCAHGVHGAPKRAARRATRRAATHAIQEQVA